MAFCLWFNIISEVSVSIYITDVTLVSEDTYEQDEKDDDVALLKMLTLLKMLAHLKRTQNDNFPRPQETDPYTVHTQIYDTNTKTQIKVNS